MKKGVAPLFSIIITLKQNLVFLSAPLQLSRDLQLNFMSCKKNFKPLAASSPSLDILLSRYWCFQTSSALFHLLLWWDWRGNGFAHFLTVFSFTICGTFCSSNHMLPYWHTPSCLTKSKVFLNQSYYTHPVYFYLVTLLWLENLSSAHSTSCFMHYLKF